MPYCRPTRWSSLSFWLHRTALLLGCGCVVVVAHAQEAASPLTSSAEGDEQATPAGERQETTRLLDRRPEFDLVILRSNGEEVRVETEILDLPGGEHTVPDPLPQSGELEFRPLGETEPYAVAWSKIRAIRLWEEMLLDEAIRLTKEGDFAEAFEYLQYLHEYYPKLSRLEEVTQTHLVQEARSLFLDDQYSESLFVLSALHARNSGHQALASAVPVVSDKLINARWEAADYAGARQSLEQLQQTFAEVPLSNIDAWRTRFTAAAEQQMQKAREALQKQDFAAARQAVRAAQDITPGIEGAGQLLAEIHELAPEMRIGVAQLADPRRRAVRTFAEARVAPLTRPTLVELATPEGDAVGAEYRFRWGTLSTRDEQLQTTLELDAKAMERGLSPEAVSLRVVEMAAPGGPHYQAEIGGLLDYVLIDEGNSVLLQWKRPYVRPAALLQTPLQGLIDEDDASHPFWYAAEQVAGEMPAIRYTRPAAAETIGPRSIVERHMRDDEDAIAQLLAGQLDAIDRLPPWQLKRLRDANGVRVGQYALPTVHVLRVNWDRPILRMREFRRALCFALDREAICRDVLLGGEAIAGFRALSGPLPAGLGGTDPIAYAYKQELEVRPYQPSLARALVGMAQATLDKNAPPEDEAATEASPGEASDSDQPSPDSPTEQASTDSSLTEPLVLLHEADPVAQLACQSIKLYLDQVGVPITLRALQYGESIEDVPHDLQYLELAVWEPLVDARPLLGDNGVAGRSTAYMNLALSRLENATNWNSATRQLKEIHEIAHYDLPLIPLWQTINYFAYLESLEGIGRQPISLYQELPEWRKTFTNQPAL